MIAAPTGVVLPADILTQPWFGVFGLFVALNTIVYLGLTAAKFIPWPAQVHPQQVRRILPHSEGDPAMKNRYRTALREIDDPVQRLRDSAARQTIPMAMALVGALTAMVGLIYVIVYFDSSGPMLSLGPVYGLVLIVTSLLLARSGASATAMRWAWTLLMIALVSENCWRASVIDSAVPLAYALIGVAFLAPIVMSWPFGISGSLACAIPIILGGNNVSVVDTYSWAISAATAVLGSLVILYLRLVPLDRIAEERARADALASTDPLTGTFSRAGLIALAPSIAEAAEQSGGDVGVVHCAIPDLVAINTQYGFEYGDEVLGATARALRASLPARALVSRWSGEAFLALMTSPLPDPEALRHEVAENFARTGIDLGKSPVVIAIGGAEGSPHRVTLEGLVAEAEARQA
ncbi:MAG: GGDEF domain-containing protein [Candidatus Nanopelagicales bacterium]